MRAASLAAGSTHPLSLAILSFAGDECRGEPLVVQTQPGLGVSADTSLGRVALGSRTLMDNGGFRWPVEISHEQAELEQQRVFIGWDGTVQGAFSFDESLSTNASAAIEACRQLDIELRLLTGDGSLRAAELEEKLGIQSQANLLPEDKQEAIAALKKQGAVAMVGDGINDAPALAAADVGVALGCGADVARDSAGVCLTGDNLLRLPWAVALARKTKRVVKQNLFWAFAYNTMGIALAASGRLNPIWAAAAMALSSFLVIANSLRLSNFDDLETSGESSPRSHSMGKDTPAVPAETENLGSALAVGAP